MVVLLLTLSLAIDNSEFNHGGGGGSGSSPAAATAVGVWVVEDRDQCRWHLMAMLALDGGHATTSWHSKRVAKQEDKRVAQGDAMQQQAFLSSAMPLQQYTVYGVVVCRTAMAIRSIVFGRTAMAIEGVVFFSLTTTRIHGALFCRGTLVVGIVIFCCATPLLVICRTTTAMCGEHNNQP